MSIITHALCVMAGGAIGVVVMAVLAIAGRSDYE